jgi:hypothetical protein
MLMLWANRKPALRYILGNHSINLSMSPIPQYPYKTDHVRRALPVPQRISQPVFDSIGRNSPQEIPSPLRTNISMDPNQYLFAYISRKNAHQPAAPVPTAAAPRNIVYLRRADGSMLPVHSANGGFLPASARVPHWTTANQAAQSKAVEERKQEAAKKKEADEARKAVCIIKHRHRLTEGLLMV